ncbi:hypothetical protein [Bradyrhizobium sp.]|uniref:hypothetical protein n=1 Tax=Bradyrhizobium sp. TaxID=376 RepID=UPI003C354458
MRSISIWAVLISNAGQLGMALAILVVTALSTLGVMWALAGLPPDIDPITDQLKASSAFVSLIASLSIVTSSLAAGYVAGRIAGRRPVLHGALSGCAGFILLICFALGGSPSDQARHGGPGAGPPMPALLSASLFLGTPLLGAFGGLVAGQSAYRRDRRGRRSRRQRKPASSRSRMRGPALPATRPEAAQVKIFPAVRTSRWNVHDLPTPRY